MRSLLFLLLIVLLIGGVAFVERRPLVQAMAGTGMLKGMYTEGNVPLPHISGANSYNIYYSPASNNSFPYSVRGIPSSMSSYTVSYLRKNTPYQYKISALNKAGKEIWWSKASSLSDVHAM